MVSELSENKNSEKLSRESRQAHHEKFAFGLLGFTGLYPARLQAEQVNAKQCRKIAAEPLPCARGSGPSVPGRFN